MHEVCREAPAHAPTLLPPGARAAMTVQEASCLECLPAMMLGKNMPSRFSFGPIIICWDPRSSRCHHDTSWPCLPARL